MIVLIPVGQIKRSVLAFISENLTASFRQKVAISERNISPEDTWDSRRGQYLADAIVEKIGKIQRGNTKLGIIDGDIFAPGLNFVFGEADRSRRSAIISLTRLKQEYYGLPSDGALFQQRVTKEAIHEIGHVLGLAHCADQTCVMHFSNTLLDTDIKNAEFCLRCQGKISPPTRGNGS